MSEKTLKGAAPVLITDLAAELIALREMFQKCQETSETHLALSMEALSEAEPILPAARALKRAAEHQLAVMVELCAITTGLSDGFVSIFQAQIDQEVAGEN